MEQETSGYFTMPLDERWIGEARLRTAERIRASCDYLLDGEYTDEELELVGNLGDGVRDIVLKEFGGMGDDHDDEVWQAFINRLPHPQESPANVPGLMMPYMAVLDGEAISDEMDAGYSMDDAVTRIVDAQSYQVETLARSLQSQHYARVAQLN